MTILDTLQVQPPFDMIVYGVGAAVPHPGQIAAQLVPRTTESTPIGSIPKPVQATTTLIPRT